MLLQNPQLAYALLQAQVVMRIVDPEIALVRLLNAADGKLSEEWRLPKNENSVFIYSPSFYFKPV